MDGFFDDAGNPDGRAGAATVSVGETGGVGRDKYRREGGVGFGNGTVYKEERAGVVGGVPEAEVWFAFGVGNVGRCNGEEKVADCGGVNGDGGGGGGNREGVAVQEEVEEEE